MLDIILIAIHVPAGLTAIIAGFVAMLVKKGGWWHRRSGLVYLFAVLTLFVSAAGLVVTRGPQFSHLLYLGLLAAALAIGGYLMRRHNQSLHIAGMGGSYIVILTAFYVDNGPKLPLWQLLPDVAFWVLPTMIGVPLILRAILWRGRKCFT